MITSFDYPARGRAGQGQGRLPVFIMLVLNIPADHKQGRGAAKFIAIAYLSIPQARRI